MDYRRIAGADVAARLATHGAVLIEGAKAVGKTTTGLALCASHVRLDRDAAARAAANADPRLVLDGSPTRLIDEYQLVPGVWEAVRGEIDERRARGLFVLTGSATPDPETTSHGGAGRIARYTMRTLSHVRTRPRDRIGLAGEPARRGNHGTRHRTDERTRDDRDPGDRPLARPRRSRRRKRDGREHRLPRDDRARRRTADRRGSPRPAGPHAFRSRLRSQRCDQRVTHQDRGAHARCPRIREPTTCARSSGSSSSRTREHGRRDSVPAYG
jgi:hypothetical protein